MQFRFFKFTPAMSATSEHALNIDRLAQLARIELAPAEKETFSAQLADILRHAGRLQRVDITGVEPATHGFLTTNVWAEDTPADDFTVEDALRNAPAQRDNMIEVPRIVE